MTDYNSTLKFLLPPQKNEILGTPLLSDSKIHAAYIGTCVLIIRRCICFCYLPLHHNIQKKSACNAVFLQLPAHQGSPGLRVVERLCWWWWCCSYVLDGYPLTKTQVMLMEQRNIIPVCVIELEVDARDCADRATADRYSHDR